MNSQWAIPNDVVQLFHPELAAIVAFQRAPSYKTALVNCEHECVEELLILSVKRNIDENAFGRSRHGFYRFVEAFLAERFLAAVFFTEDLTSFRPNPLFADFDLE